MFLSIDILVGFCGIPLYQNILQFSMLNFVFIDLWNTSVCFNLKIYTAYMNIKFLSYLVSRHILCDKYVRSACAIVMLVFICISVYAITQIIQSDTKTGSQNLIWGPAEHKQLALFFADYLNSFLCIFLVWKTKICFIHRVQSSINFRICWWGQAKYSNNGITMVLYLSYRWSLCITSNYAMCNNYATQTCGSKTWKI